MAPMFLLIILISPSSISPAIASSDSALHVDDNDSSYVTFHHYKQLAERGESAAQYALGEIYTSGKGVRQNYDEALKWYRRAAAQSHGGAEFMLGKSFTKGHGVPADKEEAVIWYRKAADHSHAEAQYVLGMINILGLVVRRDYVEAAKWHRRAAEQGHGEAQLMLGKTYAYGAGMQIDYVHAYLWLNLASVTGVRGAAEAHELVSLTMSPNQFKQAEQLSNDWWANHPEISELGKP